MALTPYCTARFWFESTSTFPTATRPEYSSANSSRIGAIILHGPHHSAQKSTRIGWADLRTSSENVDSVRLRT